MRLFIGVATAIGILTQGGLFSGDVYAQAPSFVAPPRSIADITAILDQEKPDAAKRLALEFAADKPLPSNAASMPLLAAYWDRIRARQQLGRWLEAIADLEKAIELTRNKVSQNEHFGLRHAHALAIWSAGEPRKALDLYLPLARGMDVQETRGWLFGGYRAMVQMLVSVGDTAQAETYARRAQALLSQAVSWNNWARKSQIWRSLVEQARASVFTARGELREAEAAFARAETLMRAASRNPTVLGTNTSKEGLEENADNVARRLSGVKARQGRLVEAEADLRRALLNRLRLAGKYHPVTAHFVTQLASLLTEQGRLKEAEQLSLAASEIRSAVGLAADSQDVVWNLNQTANIMALQGRWDDAAGAYTRVDELISLWDPKRRRMHDLNNNRVNALFAAGNLDAGLNAARALVTRNEARGKIGEGETAISRGFLGVGLALAGNDQEALVEFRKSAPFLGVGETDLAEDSEFVPAQASRHQEVIEGYLSVLARSSDLAGGNERAAQEAFPLAEVTRDGSVQKSMAASSARMLAREPALASAARTEQDLEKQIAARRALLNNMLALPPEERSDKSARELTAQIEKLRAERIKIRDELARRFPRYAELTDPKPPRPEDIRAILQPHEAFVSFYFGRKASFAWAFSKAGPVAFAEIGITATELDKAVRTLRRPLDGPLSDIDQIPAFDVELGYQLFSKLMAPIQSGWRSSKSIIVVTNGALGYLPLAMLPTRPVKLASQSEPLFAEYRAVPWLARTHAVSLLPSAAALRALRQIPAGSASREQLIGFGDPYFSPAQAAEAEAPSITAAVETSGSTIVRGRGLKRRAMRDTSGVNSASLALLPRLADTADELRAVAQALRADPAKALYLGRKANERSVKTLDLSRYRVIAFSTHGLVPGELDGLMQPALALTAPSVADIDGDGLLTMEEILALKLDADWVVLSACNTAIGAGAGAEAVSGLGRAFLYAGSRALLVTNWSVESLSASKLVAEVFRVQSENPMVDRAEALRRAMMHLLDGGVDAGEYTYGHPLFWAPYSLVGAG